MGSLTRQLDERAKSFKLFAWSEIVFSLSLSHFHASNKIVYIEHKFHQSLTLLFSIFHSPFVLYTLNLSLSLSPFCFIETTIFKKTMSNWQNRQVDLWHILCTCSACSLDSSRQHTAHIPWHDIDFIRLTKDNTHIQFIHPSRVCAEWWSCLPRWPCVLVFTTSHSFLCHLHFAVDVVAVVVNGFSSAPTILSTYITYHFESFISELSSSIPIRPNRWAFTFDIYGLIQVHAMIYIPYYTTTTKK